MQIKKELFILLDAEIDDATTAIANCYKGREFPSPKVGYIDAYREGLKKAKRLVNKQLKLSAPPKQEVEEKGKKL